MYGLGVSPYANIAPYQAQYAAMANPMLPAFMPTPQPTGGYGGNFVGPDGQIVPIGILQPQVPVWPVPMGNQNPNPAPQMPNIPQSTPQPNNSITNYPGSDRGHSSGPGPQTNAVFSGGDTNFVSSENGRLSVLGFSGGTGVDQYGQLHDTINFDGAQAIGGLLGMAVGIPFAGDIANWGSDKLGIQNDVSLSSLGLQGINVADVLANPDNFSSRQVKAVNDWVSATQAGQNTFASGSFDRTGSSTPNTFGVARNQDGSIASIPGWGPDGTASNAAPIPGRHPGYPGVPSGLAAVTTPSVSHTTPGLNTQVSKTSGGGGSSSSQQGGMKNPARTNTSTPQTTPRNVSSGGGSGGPAGGQTASKSLGGQGANQGGVKAGK